VNQDIASSEKKKSHFFSKKFSIKGRRDLSLFCGKSLIYDYISKKLDHERVQSMERTLKNSEELQKEASQTNLGIYYTDCLSKTKVGPEVFEKIKIPDSYFEVLLQKTQFENWPQSLKWGLEALFVSLSITIIAMVIPWERALKLNFKTDKSSVIIAELTKDNEINNKNLNETTKEAAQVDKENLFQDEGIVKATPPASKIAKVESPAPNKELVKNQPNAQSQSNPLVKVAENPKVAPEAPLQEASSPSSKKPTEALAVKAVTVSSATDSTSDSGKKTGQGFLYRGTLTASNAVVITPKLIAKMDSMGARKAGEVNLGWKKGNSFYFHFTIPESKFAELEKSMGEYGALSLQKEKHPRVMPDGIVRIIILVNEAHQ
jgi:hypothetical protein